MNIRRQKNLFATFAFALLALGSTSAFASPNHHEPPERKALLEKIHSLKVKELGDLLELDDAGRAELEKRLKPFDDERSALRLETFNAMKALRSARKNEGASDVVRAARTLAVNRMRLAEIDVRELDAVVSGLTDEKAMQASLFLTQFPRRVEKMAAQMHKPKSDRRRDD